MIRRGGFWDLLFHKQPIEKGNDELSLSIRSSIRDMRRNLNDVEKAMDQLLAQQEVKGRRNEH